MHIIKKNWTTHRQETIILLKKWRQRIRAKRQPKEDEVPKEPIRKENPFLPQLREILLQVLKQRGMDYGKLKLLLVDSDMEPESMFAQDDIQIALEQLSKDLNFLTILTDRPAYFQEYVETMYEENGLLVILEEKQSKRSNFANLVLDFEQQSSFGDGQMNGDVIYIPVYKKMWERLQNLDILVPIGYNTVIVKGIMEKDKWIF